MRRAPGLLALFWLAGCASAPPPGLPPDLAGFVARRIACFTWLGAAGADPHWAAAFPAAQAVCEGIAAERDVLAHRYGGDPKLADAIRGTFVMVVQRVPARIQLEPEGLAAPPR